MEKLQQFAIAPEADDLGLARRELAFHPVRNNSPSRLTAQQIESFNRTGFLTGVPVFSEGEIAEIREQFDTLLEAALAAGGDSYSISSAHLRHGQAWDLLSERRIVGLVRDLLGEDVIGWGCHYFCKLPHDGKRVDWHQDATYWPLTPSKTVTVWLAIDDADEANACVRFIPGSHLRGAISFEAGGDDPATVLNQRVERVGRFGEPVSNVLRAGEVSLHSDLLLHGSRANDSDRRRCGLTLRYCSADVRAYLDWNRKGVVVSGRDRSGHWADAARPDS